MRKIKRLRGIFLFMLIGTTLQAQVADQHKPAFHSLNSVGVLNGSYTSSLQLQTIQGIGYRNWFAGAGVGIDYYRYRTVPVFFDLRHYFGKAKNKIFVYGDAGNVFTWVTQKEKRQYVNSDKFKGEGYYDLGAGYQLKVGKRNGVYLSAGYSQLQIKELVGYSLVYAMALYTGGNSPLNLPTQVDRYNYTLKRLSIKLGFSF